MNMNRFPFLNESYFQKVLMFAFKSFLPSELLLTHALRRTKSPFPSVTPIQTSIHAPHDAPRFGVRGLSLLQLLTVLALSNTLVILISLWPQTVFIRSAAAQEETVI